MGAGPRRVTAEARLALTPIAVGIGSKERSRAIPQAPLAAKKGTEAPRRQSGTARLEDIVTPRLTKAVIR
jgi:hypothetical protein